MSWIKPNRLEKGDKVAIVSPSRLSASVFPKLFKLGVDNLRRFFELDPIISPHATLSIEQGYLHPELRAQDLNRAFESREIKGIISAIGGDESVRILQYLDEQVITGSPKFFCGFSDCTTITAYLARNRVCSIYGGAVMAGFAQMHNFPREFALYWRKIMFEDSTGLKMRRFPAYSEGYPDWAKSGSNGSIHKLKKSYGWSWSVGDSMTGRIFAANIEVFDWLRGTPFFPQKSVFDDAILLLETSEEMPLPITVERLVRNLGIGGILERINGLAFGRFRGYTSGQRNDVMKRVGRVLSTEFGLSETPLMEGIDFGHTDPCFPIPVGVRFRIANDEIELLESFAK
ncbi:MAG: LD-carboxypeptidase [Thermoplasmata archaeon]|nr:LD-carboxypeptidase [Candidatus Sysuiplasma acidicola]